MKVRVLLVVVLLLAAAAPAAAKPHTPQEAPDLPEDPVAFLELLAEGVFTGALLAFLFEKPGWFKNLAGTAKWWIVFAASLGIPVLAEALLRLVPAGIWTAVAPYFRRLVIGFTGWITSQAVFRTCIKPFRA